MNDFFVNVTRYCSYFVTIILGIFVFLFEWLRPLLKRPATAIALVAVIVSGLIFIVLTLRAMLGLSPV